MRKICKTIMILAPVLVMFTACNGLRDIRNIVSGTGGEIRFGTDGVRVETKAFVETDNDTLQADGFKVAAVIDADNSVMFNSAVAYSSDDAVYRPTGGSYFFPTTGTMSFYAVYPASQEIAVAGGVATLSYSQNADTDLVAAKATGVARQSTAVNLTFDHLLSQVSVKARGENSGVDYKLKSVKITGANGGTYAFADGSWTPSTTTAEYTVYSDGTGMAVGSSLTDVGFAMSFLPGTVELNVVWECYGKGTVNLVSSNDQSVNVTLEKGKHSTLNLTLPSNSSELAFVTSVGAWVNDSQEIVVKEEMIYVSLNGGVTVYKVPKGCNCGRFRELTGEQIIDYSTGEPIELSDEELIPDRFICKVQSLVFHNNNGSILRRDVIWSPISYENEEPTAFGGTEYYWLQSELNTIFDKGSIMISRILPNGYSGNQDGMREIFVKYNDKIYRFENCVCREIQGFIVSYKVDEEKTGHLQTSVA